MATEVHRNRESLQNNNVINGTLPQSTSDGDQTDLPATRRDIPTEERVENKRVHWFWDLVALVSVFTFIADIGTDLFVAALYFSKGQYTWFGLTLGFVFLSSFTLQIFSAKWLYEDTQTHDDTQVTHKKKKEKWWTYVLHILHLGPVVRYWRVFRSGWRTRKLNVNPYEYHYYLAEWRDICMLRLFEAYLESAPQLILQLYILAYHRRFNISSDLLTAITASCSLVSLAWAIVAYTNSLRDVMQHKVSWTGFFFQVMWRLSMLASRIVALVLFASFFGIWLFVTIAVHWLIMFLSLVVQYTSFCVDYSSGTHHPCREVCFNGIIAFIYNFSFFNITEGATRLKLILYYTLMLLENTACVVLWYPHSALFGNVSIAAISLVFGGFVAGLLFMIIYYQFYHPNILEKGFCFKRGEQLEGDDEHLYFTKFWCCCCEVRAVRNVDAIFDESTVAQRSLSSNGGTTLTFRARENRSACRDVDILPRHVSLEEIPRLLSPTEASYLKRYGRTEVAPPIAEEQSSPALWI